MNLQLQEILFNSIRRTRRIALVGALSCSILGFGILAWLTQRPGPVAVNFSKSPVFYGMVAIYSIATAAAIAVYFQLRVPRKVWFFQLLQASPHMFHGAQEVLTPVRFWGINWGSYSQVRLYFKSGKSANLWVNSADKDILLHHLKSIAVDKERVG